MSQEKTTVETTETQQEVKKNSQIQRSLITFHDTTTDQKFIIKITDDPTLGAEIDIIANPPKLEHVTEEGTVDFNKYGLNGILTGMFLQLLNQIQQTGQPENSKETNTEEVKTEE